MKTTFPTLAIAGISALVATVSLSSSVHAAAITADFAVDIIEGDFLVGDTFTGQVTYDDQLLTGTGTELVDPFSGLVSLSFAYVDADRSSPATYTEADDAIGSGFPVLTFVDGELIGLDYSVEITSDVGFQFREEPFASGDFGFFTDNFATFEFNTGTVAFATTPPSTSVPEPAILLGLAALAGIAVRSQQR